MEDNSKACPQCNSDRIVWNGQVRGFRRRRCHDCKHVWTTTVRYTRDRRRSKQQKELDTVMVEVRSTVRISLSSYENLQLRLKHCEADSMDELISAIVENSINAK